MTCRVAVTGLGLVSPHGEDVRAFFDALLRGESAIRLNAVGEAPHETRIPSAVCDGFDAVAVLGRQRVMTMDRVSQLAATAARSAWQDAKLDALGEDERDRSCVMWGTGYGGGGTVERGYRDLFLRGKSRLSPMSIVLGMCHAAGAQVALRLGLGGACFTYSVACSSSAIAIGEAARRIRAGECKVALAGGSEAALPYAVVNAWQSLRVIAAADEGSASACCRPFDTARTGLALGEGSAAMVLEDMDHAIARGAHIHAELVGYGSSCDHANLVAPAQRGQVRALKAALRDAEVDAAQIRYVNAHGTATPDGDPVEIGALREAFGSHAARLAVSASKSMHGHMMGATGAVEALVTVMAVETGSIPPTANLTGLDETCAGVDHVMGEGRRDVDVSLALSNSFAFGGSNAVLVFARAPR